MADEAPVTPTTATPATAAPRRAKAPRVSALMAQLQAEKVKLEEELAPYRADYEILINAPRLLECRRKIKEVSAKLGVVNDELAAIVRANGSKGIKVESGVYTKGT